MCDLDKLNLAKCTEDLSPSADEPAELANSEKRKHLLPLALALITSGVILSLTV